MSMSFDVQPSVRDLRAEAEATAARLTGPLRNCARKSPIPRRISRSACPQRDQAEVTDYVPGFAPISSGIHLSKRRATIRCRPCRSARRWRFPPSSCCERCPRRCCSSGRASLSKTTAIKAPKLRNRRCPAGTRPVRRRRRGKVLDDADEPGGAARWHRCARLHP